MEKTLRSRKILQAANFFCRSIGLKAVRVSHLPEKLAGERSFTLADLDAIQAIVPDDPHLQAYWYSALCSTPVSPVPTIPADGTPLRADPASHPPLFPSPAAGAIKEAA